MVAVPALPGLLCPLRRSDLVHAVAIFRSKAEPGLIFGSRLKFDRFQAFTPRRGEAAGRRHGLSLVPVFFMFIHVRRLRRSSLGYQPILASQPSLSPYPPAGPDRRETIAGTSLKRRPGDPGSDGACIKSLPQLPLRDARGSCRI